MNIQSLAQTIKAWQSSKGMSNAQLLKRFPAIGSPRTLNRLAEGQLDNVESERYEHEYQRVVDMLELESGGIAGEVIYDDLYFCVSIMLKVRDLLKERGNNRLLIVEGPSGSGKSTLAMMIASKFGNAMVYTEANETWKDSILTFLRGLLRALGVSEPPKVIDDCMAKLLALLTTGEPRCLLIDEAHHLGPRTLNLIKTILNQTGSHIIFFAIPKLLQDLERAAYMEAMQLTHNRLFARVRLNQLVAKDVEHFINRRCSIAKADLRAFAESVADRSSFCGLWNFIGLVCRRACDLAGSEQITLDLWKQAISDAAASRASR